jgi:hypothetical protein
MPKLRMLQIDSCREAGFCMSTSWEMGYAILAKLREVGDPLAGNWRIVPHLVVDRPLQPFTP